MHGGRARAAVLAVSAVLAALPATDAAARPSVAGAPGSAYVGVSVATLWTRPTAPRPIDRAALGPRPDLRAWNRSLDIDARRGLVGRIETQALLGERVLVLQRRGAWARVVVPDQPTPRDSRGYPGWVPAVQLTRSGSFGPLLGGSVAVVMHRTAWLRLSTRRIELSYGTRLPVVRTSDRDVLVATPAGATGRIRAAAVAVRASSAAIPAPSGRRIVADARRFLGAPYMWGGTSAFALDCSGLIELVYRAHGIRLPRDADAQALAGRAVPRSQLRAGDALFYGRAAVHHAALFVGDGRMIEAPNSAARVRVSGVRAADYAGARRFLPPTP
jgi:gamma-D-glutamyl-L-lysine dipeptidyl-peptidase